MQSPYIVAQIATAYIVTIQKNVLLPYCTEIRPSLLVSQHAVAAVCRPVPLFSRMMQVTTYLNIFWSLVRSLMHESMICWHHWFTLSF